MKVSITIAQAKDGSYSVLYLGNDAEAAVAALRKDQAENVECVAVFRKPPVYKRRSLEAEALVSPKPAKKK